PVVRARGDDAAHARDGPVPGVRLRHPGRGLRAGRAGDRDRAARRALPGPVPLAALVSLARPPGPPSLRGRTGARPAGRPASAPGPAALLSHPYAWRNRASRHAMAAFRPSLSRIRLNSRRIGVSAASMILSSWSFSGGAPR